MIIIILNNSDDVNELVPQRIASEVCLEVGMKTMRVIDVKEGRTDEYQNWVKIETKLGQDERAVVYLKSKDE